MVNVRSNAGKGARGNRRSFRRGSLSHKMAKVRYGAPTARNQRKSLLANTKAIDTIKRKIRKHWIFTDYQLSTYPTIVNQTWFTYRLIDFAAMRPVMREDSNVQDSSHTFIKRMQINWRCLLNDSASCTANIFIVTPRATSGSRSFVTDPLVIDKDYIENINSSGSQVRLNPSVVKVHWSKYATLTRSSLSQNFTPAQNAGNPLTTYRKGQISLDLNMPVTLPSIHPLQTNWLEKNPDELPYYFRYQMLILMQWIPVTGPLGQNPQFFTDTLFTMINSD